MACKECSANPVFSLVNRSFCRKHYIEYYESKVLRTIRNYHLLGKEENIAVAISGGKDSTTTLYILNQIAKQNPKIKIFGILIDEGIAGYRDKTLKDAQKFCKKHKIKLYVYSFKKEFGKTLDELSKFGYPCSICGVFRRMLLNQKARELKATKLATGHNLDDECQSVIMNQIKVNWQRSATLGPITGIISDKKFITRIKPLYLVSDKETAAYAFLMKFPVMHTECPYIHDSFRHDVRNALNDLEEKHPGSKNGIINSFLEILPDLKRKYSGGKLNYCKYCSDPCQEDVCKSCELVKKYKLKFPYCK